MVLTIDIGNSNIVLGGYENGSLLFMTRIATDRYMEADQYAIELDGVFRLYKVDSKPLCGVIISSVVPRVTPMLTKALSHFTNTKPHILSLKDSGPLTVDIENPAELGMDILASVLAAQSSYPLPAIIIDMGTATKLTGVDAQNALRGVAIIPGLFVSLEALVGGTSLLQSVALEAPPLAIGRNTTQSMQSGIVLGTAATLDGMIDRFEQELGGEATVIATGGAAPLIIPHCHHKIHFSDTLILDGLYAAYKRLSDD